MLKDQREILAAFNAHGVKYLVVGGHAVGIHSEPRGTKDLDIFIKGPYVKEVDLNLSGNFASKLPQGASSFQNLAGNAVGVLVQGLAGPMRILYKLTQISDE